MPEPIEVIESQGPGNTENVNEVTETPEVSTPTESAPDSTSGANETVEDSGTVPYTPNWKEYLNKKRDGADTSEKPTLEPAAAKPEAKVPAKPATKVPAPEVKPLETPAAVPQNKPVVSKSKDFTGIDDGDRIFFRDMSNDTFVRQKQIYLENKELKKQVEVAKTQPAPAPSYFSGHPEAYRLTPEYAKAQKSLSVASTAENYLIQQIQNISEGKQWEALMVDDKGELVTAGEKSEPTEAARLQLEGQLRRIVDVKIQQERQLRDMGSQYTQEHAKDIQKIRAVESDLFPGYDKPDHPTAPVQKKVIEMLPPSQRSNPLASTLAMTVANNLIFQKQLEDRNSRIAELETQLKALNGKSAMPNKDKVTAPISGGGDHGSGVEIQGKVYRPYSELKKLRAGDL